MRCLQSCTLLQSFTTKLWSPGSSCGGWRSTDQGNACRFPASARGSAHHKQTAPQSQQRVSATWRRSVAAVRSTQAVVVRRSVSRCQNCEMYQEGMDVDGDAGDANDTTSSTRKLKVAIIPFRLFYFLNIFFIILSGSEKRHPSKRRTVFAAAQLVHEIQKQCRLVIGFLRAYQFFS